MTASLRVRAQSGDAYHGEEMRRSLAWLQTRSLGLLPETFFEANLQVWCAQETEAQPTQGQAFADAAQRIRRAYKHGLCELDLANLPIQTLPQALGRLVKLRRLNLSGCTELRAVPDPISQLDSLERLNLTACIGLQQVPNWLCKLDNLQELRFLGCAQLRRLPDDLGELGALKRLDLSGCSALTRLPATLARLKGLDLSLDDTLSLPAKPPHYLSRNGVRVRIGRHAGAWT